jgi:hypothetical protein
MTNEVTPTRSGFHADPESGVCYRTLDFMGFPGYRIGDDGSVWTCLVSVGVPGMRGSASHKDSVWRRMKTQRSHNGYCRVTLRKDRRSKPCVVARLVLTSFVGPRPFGTESCHFPDRNPENNSLRNLRWDTKKANASDKKIQGSEMYGTRNHKSKLTEDKVRGMRRDFIEHRLSYAECGRRYGVTTSTAKKIVDRVLWSHVA